MPKAAVVLAACHQGRLIEVLLWNPSDGDPADGCEVGGLEFDADFDLPYLVDLDGFLIDFTPREVSVPPSSGGGAGGLRGDRRR